MCGITCIYNLDGTVINTSQLEKITNKIRHRGPDDEGYLCIDTSTNQIEFAFGKDTHPELKNQLIPLSQVNDVNFAFGFRRLAIQDLSVNGHQPMSDFTKKIFIVFNGEIYNFIELRKELKSRGYQFNSMTDTEVILNAYLEWGEACVKKFNGMWAFAIWDTRTKTLFCSRDRFGIKPFYYHMEEGKHFHFASEIKALLVSVTPKINSNALYKYLYFDEKDTTHETFFEEIYQLLPGHNLLIKQGKVSIDKYYKLPSQKLPDTYQVAQEKIKKLFNKAVQIRLRSDVTVGFALSGGIDSSAIVTSAHQFSGVDNKKTFSVVFPNDEIDESAYVDEIIKQTKFENYQVTPNAKDLETRLKKFIYHLEEPIPDLSYFNDFYLREQIKSKEVTVSLEGQGADEILAGYRSFILPYYFDLLDRFQLRKLLREKRNFNGLINISYKTLLGRYFLSKFPSGLSFRIKMYYNESHFKIYNKAYFKAAQIENKRKPLRENHIESVLFNALTSLSIPKLLIRGDKNCMAHSLESRFPFLDHELVEYLFQLPSTYKIRGGITKLIFRDSVKELLPRKIFLRRDKVGFISPQQKWINEMSTFLDKVIYSDEFKNCSYINWDIFEKQYSSSKSNSLTTTKEIWKIIGVFLWEQQFLKNRTTN